MDVAPNSSNLTEALLQELSQDISKICQLRNELETLNQNITVTGNSVAKSELLNRKEKCVFNLIQSTSQKFTILASHSITEQVTKMHAERLKSDFQRCLQRFQRIQMEIKKRLLLEKRQAEPPVADLLGMGEERAGEDEPSDGLLFQTANTQVQLRADQGDIHELGYALQQEEQMQLIEEDIATINTIFQQLSTLVYDQRAAIDSIEDNVEAAYTNQEAGTTHLAKAASSRQRSRRRCCICGIVLAVTVSVVILVLVLVYGPSWKH